VILSAIKKMESEYYLHVLGSGDAFGSGGRNQTAFYIKSPEANILVDCGASILSSLKRNDLSTNDIDVVVLTHFHGDHFAGVPFLLLDAAVIAKRKKKLKIISPGDGEWKIKQLFNLLYPGSEAIFNDLDLEFLYYDKYETIREDKYSITAFPAIHSEHVFPHSLKISIGEKTIGFSGDTAWTEDLIEVAKNTDLFICECNFYSTENEGHLLYKVLEEKKALFKSNRLLLTHLGDEMLNKLSEVDLEICEDNQIYPF
jgi:ribonuclease BN (tRNA processing enzyme)